MSAPIHLVIRVVCWLWAPAWQLLEDSGAFELMDQIERTWR